METEARGEHTCEGWIQGDIWQSGIWHTRTITTENGETWDNGEAEHDPNCGTCQREEAATRTWEDENATWIIDMEWEAEQAAERAWEER